MSGHDAREQRSCNGKKGIWDYLEGRGLRKTTERYTILEELYAHDEHLDVDTLHLRMRAKQYKISRATIYNNLDLLIDSGLIRRHQFGKGMAFYKKCYFRKQHDHIILTDTGEIKEFCDPRIQNIKRTIEDTFGIVVSRHSLYFYGTKNQEGDNRLKIRVTE